MLHYKKLFITNRKRQLAGRTSHFSPIKFEQCVATAQAFFLDGVKFLLYTGKEKEKRVNMQVKKKQYSVSDRFQL
jgi:hypothetical protein